MVRYSFLVGLFHSLLHAGLSRRTALAIMRVYGSGIATAVVFEQVQIFLDKLPGVLQAIFELVHFL